jgi:hypothetical protein
VIGSLLVDGLGYNPLTSNPDKLRIEGTPTTAGLSYVYLRLNDADGDPAWRTYTIRTVGGLGTLVESDFMGTNPAQHLPWTKYYVKAPDCIYTGWGAGSGIFSRDGDNALVWSVNAPANEQDSTLALAIADNEYLTVSVAPPSTGTLNLRNEELRFTIRRIDYHAPRRYAVFTSIEGFSDGNELFSSDRSGSTADLEYVFRLPDTPVYESITGPVEIRIYGYSGQYGGHKTSLIDFKLNGTIPGNGNHIWRFY